MSTNSDTDPEPNWDQEATGPSQSGFGAIPRNTLGVIPPRPQQPPRLQGGADRDVDPQPAPARRQVPPAERPLLLTQQQLARARTLLGEVKLIADFAITDHIGLLAYQGLLQGKPEDYDPSGVEVLQAAKVLHDEQASWEIREQVAAEDPFLDQLYHLMKLAGLPIRSWQTLIDAVFFYESEENVKLIKRAVYASRYQGFDPSIILRKLIKSWQEGRRAPYQNFQIHCEIDGQPDEWNYNNHQSFMNDMTILVLCFLNRGAVIGKILKKSAKDYNALMRMLIAKYNIRANEETERRRRAEALGPEVITLPRISACLCQLTTELYSRGFGRPIANFSEFGNVPVAIFSPMFPSVVRKGYRSSQGVMINIHPQLILINILVDNVLHVRDRVTPLDQIWTFFLASHNSGVLLDSARIEQCNKFGVTVDGCNKFGVTVTVAR